jgi:hypothetical protein
MRSVGDGSSQFQTMVSLISPCCLLRGARVPLCRGLSCDAAKYRTAFKRNGSLHPYWSKQLASPPNHVTLSRIASAPLLSYWIISNRYPVSM